MRVDLIRMGLLVALVAVCGWGQTDAYRVDFRSMLQVGAENCFSITPARSLGANSGVSKQCWVHTPKRYGDMRIRFKYRMDQWAEGMVVLRAAEVGAPSRTGIGVMLAHDFHNKATMESTGAVAHRVATQALPLPSYDIFHSAEIEALGQLLTVKIDGREVLKTTLTGTDGVPYGEPFGYVGFVNLQHGYEIRDLEVQDLDGSVPELIEIDKELEDWQKTGHAEWRGSDDGVLSGMKPDGIIYAEPVLQDFELYFSFRTTDRINSGLFLRASPPAGSAPVPRDQRGFEVQIYAPPDAVYPTGSLYNVMRAEVWEDLDEQWARMRVRVVAGTIRVWLNGRPVLASPLPEGTQPQGRIGFQEHSKRGRIDVRDISFVRVAPGKP